MYLRSKNTFLQIRHCWSVPEKYYNAEYNSGFEIIAYIGEEQVFSKKFQFKLMDFHLNQLK
jgi:hypothetical protein